MKNSLIFIVSLLDTFLDRLYLHQIILESQRRARLFLCTGGIVTAFPPSPQKPPRTPENTQKTTKTAHKHQHSELGHKISLLRDKCVIRDPIGAF